MLSHNKKKHVMCLILEEEGECTMTHPRIKTTEEKKTAFEYKA